MSESRLLITLCTYNEAENLPRLLDEIRSVAPAADILVIDDNSPDGTGQLADERAGRDPQIRVLHRPGKLGLGTATIAGFQQALDGGYDFVLNLDADFSHPPQSIPALVQWMSQADVAIGSRYVSGGSIQGWGWLRHVMSRGINWYARLLLGLANRDTSGAFRCYRVSLLRRLDFQRFRATGYAFQEEVLYRCQRAGARCVETPITFVDRRQGTSKINGREALRALWVIFLLGLERLFRRNPEQSAPRE